MIIVIQFNYLKLIHKEQSQTDKRIFYLRPTNKILKNEGEYNKCEDNVIVKIEKSCTKDEIQAFLKIVDIICSEYELN
ncbi:MAG: hypothetical protein ACRC5H_08625 [Treponemataceae bacterium]